MVSHRRRKQKQRQRPRKLQCEALETRYLLAADAATAFASPWQPLATIPASPSGAASYLSLDRYAAWQVDTAELRAQLAAAPLEFTATAAEPLTWAIPTPTGELPPFCAGRVANHGAGPGGAVS